MLGPWEGALGSEASLTQILPDGVGDGGVDPEGVHGGPPLLPGLTDHPGVSTAALQPHITDNGAVRLTEVRMSPSTTVALSSSPGNGRVAEAVADSLVCFICSGELPEVFLSRLQLYLPRFLHRPPVSGWVMSKPRLQVVEGFKSREIPTEG